MRYAIVFIASLLLLTGFTFQREIEMEFEGEIDYVSKVGSPVAESVVVIQGDGYGRHASMSKVSADSHNHDSTTYSEGLKVTVGTKMADGQTYLQTIDGDGHLDMLFDAQVNGFPTVDVYAHGSIADGFYGRYIDVEVEGLSLYELMRLVGTGEVKDWIRFAPAEDE